MEFHMSNPSLLHLSLFSFNFFLRTIVIINTFKSPFVFSFLSLSFVQTSLLKYITVVFTFQVAFILCPGAVNFLILIF